jgi:hypothetical protein
MRHITGDNTMHPGTVTDLLVQRRTLQQRLGGDAADVQAGPAKYRLAVLPDPVIDADGLQAQLGAADCGNITGRPGTDDDCVIAVHKCSRL